MHTECKAPKTTPPKCVNCKGNHTANYKGCPYYKSKISPREPPRVTAVERIRAEPARRIVQAEMPYALPLRQHVDPPRLQLIAATKLNL